MFGLQGNIRVFCRVRPVSQEEQDSADAKTMLSFDSDDDAILYLSNKGKVMTFELDKVFPPHATQEEVSVLGIIKPETTSWSEARLVSRYPMGHDFVVIVNKGVRLICWFSL